MKTQTKFMWSLFFTILGFSMVILILIVMGINYMLGNKDDFYLWIGLLLLNIWGGVSNLINAINYYNEIKDSNNKNVDEDLKMKFNLD